MAQIPTLEESKRAQQAAQKKITDKRSKQRKLGKEFNVPDDGHHAGVIPEAIWKGLKK